MVRQYILYIYEILLLLFCFGLHYQSYLFVNNPNIFPVIQVDIAYYYLSREYNSKGLIYIVIFDFFLDHTMLLSDAISYLVSQYYFYYANNRNNPSYIIKFIDVCIFTLIFLSIRYLILSLYALDLLNYYDMLLQALTTSLAYPLVEYIFVNTRKVICDD